MTHTTKNIVLTAIIATAALFVNAQTGIYIAPGTNVFFADSATAFSSVKNDGNVNVAKSAVVNFEGKKWSNGEKATIAGEGAVRFAGKDAQQIDGGYNAATREGAAFTALQIDNKAGVELVNSNAKVSNVLELKKGLLIVNENILTVGNNNAGTITGADAKKYIVTGNKEGYLLRESISNNDGSVVFPVGTFAGYTPATVRNTSAIADNMYVNVADGVANMDARLTVNKTWTIGKQFRPSQDEVEVSLQHIAGEEGRIYAQNSNKAFVAEYSHAAWTKATSKIGFATAFTKTVNKPVVAGAAAAVTAPSYKLNVWPNPTANLFNIGITGDIKIQTVIVWNIVGVEMVKKAVNNQNVIQVSNLIPGTYVVGFISSTGQIIETRKVVVAGF